MRKNAVSGNQRFNTPRLEIADVSQASDYTACANCDALWLDIKPTPGQRVRCGRCHTVMRTERPAAIDRVLAVAVATPVLMGIALTASFLRLSGGSANREASVLDAAAAIATAGTWPLTLAVGAMIVALPILRAVALIYVLLPIRLGYTAAKHAAAAFRLTIAIRPWSMAEIFLIGVAVALVKVSGLASVTIGPAFWAFASLAFLTIIEDAARCERSIWERLA